MEQCKKAKDRENINDQLLNISTILDFDLIDRFYNTLQSTMKLVLETFSTSSFVGEKPNTEEKT